MYKRQELVKLVYPVDRMTTLTVTQETNGPKITEHVVELDKKLTLASGVIGQSLQAAANNAGLRSRHVSQLTKIFGQQIDFKKGIRKNDSFDAVSYTHLKWRTAIPLGPASAPGCDEPTSRCQTPPSI